MTSRLINIKSAQRSLFALVLVAMFTGTVLRSRPSLLLLLPQGEKKPSNGNTSYLEDIHSRPAARITPPCELLNADTCDPSRCKLCNVGCQSLDVNCAPYTVVPGLIGGLGNRLFILLSTRGIAESNLARLVLLPDPMIQQVFRLQESRITIAPAGFNLTNFHIHPGGLYGYQPTRISRNTVVGAFLQNPRYFAPTVDDIARSIDLDFQPQVTSDAQALLRTLSKCGAEQVVSHWVGVHVRRFPDRHVVERAPNPQAIGQQIERVLQQCAEEHGTGRTVTCGNQTLSSCCAAIFSNDPPWIKENIRNVSCVVVVENELLVDPGQPKDVLPSRNTHWASNFGRDMAAMTMCDYLVLTVGTYGYFAGILHDKRNKKPRS